LVAQLVHVIGVELRLGLDRKILRDVGQVAVQAVPLGIDLEAEEVADPLGFGEALKGPGLPAPCPGLWLTLLSVYHHIFIW